MGSGSRAEPPKSEVYRNLGPGSYDPHPATARTHTIDTCRDNHANTFARYGSLLKEARSVGPGAYHARTLSGDAHYRVPNVASYFHALGDKASRRHVYTAKMVKPAGHKVQQRAMTEL